jgi:hypothetical protein
MLFKLHKAVNRKTQTQSFSGVLFSLLLQTPMIYLIFYASQNDFLRIIIIYKIASPNHHLEKVFSTTFRDTKKYPYAFCSNYNKYT